MRVSRRYSLESRTPMPAQHLASPTTLRRNGKAVLVFQRRQHRRSQATSRPTFRHSTSGGRVPLRGRCSATSTSRTTCVYDNPGPAVRIDKKVFAGSEQRVHRHQQQHFGNCSDRVYRQATAVIINALDQSMGRIIATNNWWGERAPAPAATVRAPATPSSSSAPPALLSPWLTARHRHWPYRRTTVCRRIRSIAPFEAANQPIRATKASACHDPIPSTAPVDSPVMVDSRLREHQDRPTTPATGYMLTTRRAGEYLELHRQRPAEPAPYNLQVRVASCRPPVANSTSSSTPMTPQPARPDDPEHSQLFRPGVNVSPRPASAFPPGRHDLHLVIDTNRVSGGAPTLTG